MRKRKFENKIIHLEKNQGIDLAQTQTKKPVQPQGVPRMLQEFKDLRIFGTKEKFPKPAPLAGPFIGSKMISLSEGEKKVLSKDPKFSVRYDIDKIDFKIETEKMISKQKYGENFKNKNKKSQDCA